MIEIHELQRAKSNLVVYEQHAHFHQEIALLSKNKQLSKTYALIMLDSILIAGLLTVRGWPDNTKLNFDLKLPIVLSKTSRLTALMKIRVAL